MEKIKENKPDKIIIHHTADSYSGEQFNKINAWHGQRQFPLSSLGFFIGYHYLIERSGMVRQGRADGDVGAHTAGQNYTSIGIGLAGNFNYELPTKEREEALAILLKDLMKKYQVPLGRVWAHRRFAATSCFGALLKDNWPVIVYIKAEVNLILKIVLWIQNQLNQIKARVR